MKFIEDINILYRDYIKQYILADQHLPDVELIASIISFAPDINQHELAVILNSRMKINVGVTPCFVTDAGVFMLAGLSERQGAQYRGAVLVATGAREPQDTSIFDIACREMYEELGLVIGDIFVTNIKNSLRLETSKLGSTLESAALSLNAFIKKDISSISCFVTLMIPFYATKNEMLDIISKANIELAINRKIYSDCVDVYYKHKRDAQLDESLFIAHARSKIDFYQTYLKQNNTINSQFGNIQTATLQNLISIDQESINETNLLRYLIDLTENSELVTVSFEELLATKRSPNLKTIPVKTFNTGVQEFMTVCVDAVHMLLQTYNVVNTTTLIKSFNANREGMINNLSKIQPQSMISKADTYDKDKRAYITALTNLLYANNIFNPRSLSIHGLRQIALGDIYLTGCKQGAFITQNQIVSHVAAARVSQGLNFISIKSGMALYQYARPGGYLGDYYVDSDDISPESIGTSSIVTNPNNPLELVSRVKVKLFVTSDVPRLASVTIAEDVVDSWSITGKIVQCSGGGKQIYLPINSFEKQQFYVIVAPPKDSNPDEYKLLEEIALKNKIRLVESKLEETKSSTLNSASQFNFISYFDNSIHHALSLINIGNLQGAIVALDKYINSYGVGKDYKMLAKAMRVVLLLSSGDINNQANYANQFLEYIARKIDPSNDEKQIEFLLRYHLARNIVDSYVSITELEKLLSSTSYTEITPIIKLDIAIRYNQIAGKYSDEITYEDFNDSGEISYNKFKYAKKAQTILEECLHSSNLPVQERIIALIEISYSLHKQKNNVAALEQLLLAKNAIDDFVSIAGSDLYNTHLRELRLQMDGLMIAIGLNLTRLQKNKDLIPEDFKLVDPISVLYETSIKLEQIPMQAKIILQRWIGANANDLFIEGWYNSDTENAKQGTNLIEVYRKYIPLDMNKIIYNLERNYVTELDLAYLGMEEPAGISDTVFAQFAAALAKNKSLQKLFIRKFAIGSSNSATNSARGSLLFDALNTAQHNGQRLIYLSYSASRIQTKEEKASIHEFLRNNTSLLILQPSLYDWNTIDDITEFAMAIGNHPTLKTILTGIFKTLGAGKVLYEHCRQSNSLSNIYTFPGTLLPDRDRVAIENNNYLLRLDHELKSKKMPRNYLENELRAYLTTRSILKNTSPVSKITQHDDLVRIKQTIAELPVDGTLILYDIDLVLIMAEEDHYKFDQDIALSTFFENKSAPEIEHLRSIKRMQQQSNMVTSSTLTIFNELNNLGYKSFGITAHGTGKFGLIPSKEDFRIRELESFDIRFTQNNPNPTDASTNDLLPHLPENINAYPTVKKGIIFTDKVEKGDTLKAYLKYINMKPKRIVLIDDMLFNLENVQKFANDSGIDFIGFHYTYVQNLDKKPVKQKVLQLQYELLDLTNEWHTVDETIQILSERDKAHIEYANNTQKLRL